MTFRIYNYGRLYPAVTRWAIVWAGFPVQVGYGDVVVVASRSAEEMAIGKLSNKEGGGQGDFDAPYGRSSLRSATW